MVRIAACLACCLCCTAIATESNPDQSTGTMTRETQPSKIPRIDSRANVMQFPKRLLLEQAMLVRLRTVVVWPILPIRRLLDLLDGYGR